jgi:S-DNA-T family DNA segregation ATPase FtsK/SpoIIIE
MFVGLVGMGYFFKSWSRFDKAFKNLNLGINNSYPILKYKEKTETGKIYHYTLPCGLSLDDFDRSKQALSQYIGRELDIRYTYKELVIEVFDRKVKTMYEYQPEECNGPVGYPIGYDRKGQLITCDLSKGEPHMLIAGETGSGKSTALRAIITNLILKKNVKLHLIDLKCGAELQIFAKCNKVESFARSRHEAEVVLKHISREVDRRYDLFFQSDVINIKEYNKRVGSMGYEVVVIDEFADLHEEKDSITLLEDIAARARACGIHLIISTQRPDHKVLNGRIKANVACVLGLKTINDLNSQIIIDKPGLEELRGNGHGLLRSGGKFAEVQCPYLTEERARELIQPFNTKRKTVQIDRVDGVVPNFDFLEKVN